MHPRQVRLGRIPAPATRVRFEADEGAELTLEGAPADAASAAIRGPARSLALLAWGRAGLDDPEFRIAGDRAALSEVLATGLTP